MNIASLILSISFPPYLLLSPLFPSLTLLVGLQAEHLACKKLSDEALEWFCLKPGANDLHMVQLMPLPLHPLLLH